MAVNVKTDVATLPEPKTKKDSSEIWLKKYSAKIWFRASLLVLAFVLLVLIFSPNNIQLRDELRLVRPPEQQQLSSTSTSAIRIEGLRDTQYKKANEEIKMLQEQIDTWFHYKFILIGGMIALFLGHFGILGIQNPPSPKKSEKVLVATLMSNRTSILLALICIVAFVIDMHIRTHLTAMQNLGHWIYYYVEPSYFNAIGAPTGTIPREELVATQFFPWEAFIHAKLRQEQYANPLYRASYSFQLHFMTIAIYMLYLIVFQNVCLLCKRGKQQQVAFLGFIMVHVAALAFIIVGHTISNSYEVKCFPISGDDCWKIGSQGSTYYLGAWLLLVIVSLPYLHLLWPGLKSNKENASDPVPVTS